jgi:hypothetical protein
VSLREAEKSKSWASMSLRIITGVSILSRIISALYYLYPKVKFRIISALYYLYPKVKFILSMTPLIPIQGKGK